MGDPAKGFRKYCDFIWQRCVVHWYRNVFRHVPSTKVREIAAMLKATHAGDDIVVARQTLQLPLEFT